MSARIDTTLLRAAAALLVANSHLEAYYSPAWLAGDGLLGNSLFFLLAGYGLAMSHAENQRSFSVWFLRRMARMYPALWLVVGCATLVNAVGRPTDLASGFLW